MDSFSGGSLPLAEVDITKLVSLVGKIIDFTKNDVCLKECITALVKLTSGAFVAAYTAQVVINCNRLLSNLVEISSTTGPLQELALDSLQTISGAPHFLTTLTKILSDNTVHSNITIIACDVLASICSKGSSEVLNAVLGEDGLISAVIKLANIKSPRLDVQRAAIYCILNFFHGATAEQALDLIITWPGPVDKDCLTPIMDLLQAKKIEELCPLLVVKALETVRVILGKNFATVADWDMVAVTMLPRKFWTTAVVLREHINEDIRAAALQIDRNALRLAIVARLGEEVGEVVGVEGGGSGGESSSK
jgi:hypothetical protein